jgi:DNA-binding MarR family transcriptional regulator
MPTAPRAVPCRGGIAFRFGKQPSGPAIDSSLSLRQTSGMTKVWTPEAAALTELILEVFRVNGDLLAEGDRIAGEHGQSSARWQVLGAIVEQVRTVPGIAREMGLTRQSVQRTVDVLESEGIVEYLDNPAHRRSRLVAMTPRGREIYREILALQVQWSNGLAKELGVSQRDIRRALVLLRDLRAQLESPRANKRMPSQSGKAGDNSTRGGVRT